MIFNIISGLDDEVSPLSQVYTEGDADENGDVPDLHTLTNW